MTYCITSHKWFPWGNTFSMLTEMTLSCFCYGPRILQFWFGFEEWERHPHERGAISKARAKVSGEVEGSY